MRDWNIAHAKKLGIGDYVFSIPMRDWNCGQCPPECRRKPCVFSIPMRDWNQEAAVRIAKKGIVFSIPMRDWNKFSHSAFKRSSSCFQHTYEGLKLDLREKDGRRFKVFSIPMRDWNGYTPNIPEQNQTVFSIPMRDWNILKVRPLSLRWGWFSAYLWGIETLPLTTCAAWFARFQHTYEGLKPLLLSFFWLRHLCFQHTYEGLKRYGRCQSPDCIYTRFQHTYEGLKLNAEHFICPLRVLVFSIPMRDWN